jgi:hypothetical protein
MKSDIIDTAALSAALGLLMYAFIGWMPLGMLLYEHGFHGAQAFAAFLVFWMFSALCGLALAAGLLSGRIP